MWRSRGAAPEEKVLRALKDFKDFNDLNAAVYPPRDLK